MKTGKDRVEEKQTDVERKTIKQRLMSLVFVTVSEWDREKERESGMFSIRGQRSKKLHFVQVQQGSDQTATLIFWFRNEMKVSSPTNGPERNIKVK